MPKAAFCSQCGENVYLNDDGTCPKGHGPEALSNSYDAPEPPPVNQGPVDQPTVTQVPGAPVPGGSASKSKLPLIIGIIIVLLLCCVLSACGAVWFLDSDDSTSTENPLTDEEIAATEERQDDLDSEYGDVRDDAERMVKYFYPEFRAHEMAPAGEAGSSVDYHIIAESEDAPGFSITFFATRSEDLAAEGADDSEFAYVDEEAGVVWLHPRTGPTGLATFAGPNALVNPTMRNQIMGDFLGAHSEPLFMTEFQMHNNVDISLVGIGQDDLDAWYEDFTTWQSDWDNDLQAGRWVERSFEYTDE